ncbi:hypothetical protein C8Q80DRAFT_1187929 [Daedaleopsis nitida]|nr:hypothetical protein C8Q80DRAFT_1187929 [Daedaleopsis nitida]
MRILGYPAWGYTIDVNSPRYLVVVCIVGLRGLSNGQWVRKLCSFIGNASVLFSIS